MIVVLLLLRVCIVFKKPYSVPRLSPNLYNTIYTTLYHYITLPVSLSKAIATLDNAPARAAVQTVAAQREIVTQPQRQRRHATTNKQHHQPIQFHTWEHDEFYHHMVVRQPQGAMDHVCGTSRMRRDATTNDKKSSTTSSSSLVGYQELYESFLLEDSIPPFGTKNPSFAARTNSSSSSSWADDLMISCLLRTGNADGYVKPTVHVFSPIVRGRHGVAAQYYNHSTEEAENDPQQQQQQNHHDHTTTTTTKGRIHSDLLLLPILSFEELALPTAQRVASTELPKRMTEFLQSTLSTHWNRRHHNNNDDDDDNPLNSLDDASINRQWEEFLYHAIVEQEGTRGTWAFFMAVCRPEDRVRFLTHGEAHDRHRLIATTCRRRQSENLTRTTPFVADSYHWQSTYDEEDLVSDQQDCCLFFDTTQKSFQKE